MKYHEAQKLSVSGVAVRGNPVMQDVIWPVISDHPFGWITNGYVPIEAEKLRESDGWEPLHPARQSTQTS